MSFRTLITRVRGGRKLRAVLAKYPTVPVALQREIPRPATQALLDNLPISSESELAQAMKLLSKEAILEKYASDPWICNFLINWWEYVHGVDTLTTYPWNITIPIADVCNARCTFCSSWIEGTRVLKLEEVERFAEVLRYARLLGIAGHGEPLAHPNGEEIFDRISRYTDPRCQSYIITNGVFLNKRRELLEKLNVTTYNISLNAATPPTHDVVMGLGSDAFAAIIESIRALVQLRHRRARSIAQRLSGQQQIQVNISFVITRDNVHEIADFVRLGNELGVTNIYLRTLSPISILPAGLNYHRLPPYLHPEFERHVAEAKEAIAASQVNIITDIASWRAPVLSQQVVELVQINSPALIDRKDAVRSKDAREFYARNPHGSGQPAADALDLFEDGTNPFNRQPPYHCYFLYHDLILNDFNFRMIPCCYMSSVPGFEQIIFDGRRPFMQDWNSPAFVTLRRRLHEGPLYGACKKCPVQPVPF